MMTDAELSKMRDHNGWPIIFTEYGPLGDARFIVKPFAVHGNIGDEGPKSGQRVVYQIRWDFKDFRVSCRSKDKLPSPYKFPVTGVRFKILRMINVDPLTWLVDA